MIKNFLGVQSRYMSNTSPIIMSTERRCPYAVRSAVLMEEKIRCIGDYLNGQFKIRNGLYCFPLPYVSSLAISTIFFLSQAS